MEKETSKDGKRNCSREKEVEGGGCFQRKEFFRADSQGKRGERERCYSFGGEAIESFQRGSNGEEEEYFQRERSLHGIDSQSVRERGEGVTVLLEGKGSGN